MNTLISQQQQQQQQQQNQAMFQQSRFEISPAQVQIEPNAPVPSPPVRTNAFKYASPPQLYTNENQQRDQYHRIIER